VSDLAAELGETTQGFDLDAVVLINHVSRESR